MASRSILLNAVRLVRGRLRKHIAHGPRFAAEQDAEQRVDSGEEALVGGLVHAEGEARHELRLTGGDWAATHSSAGTITSHSIVRPVSSDVIPAISPKVGAALAVSVVGPS